MVLSDEVMVRERKVTDLNEMYFRELYRRTLAPGRFVGREKSEGWHRVGGEQQRVGRAQKENS